MARNERQDNGERTDGDPTHRLAEFLAGGGLAVSGVLGFLNATGGERDRILRNHGTQAFFALVLVGLAIGIGLIAPLIRNREKVEVCPEKRPGSFLLLLIAAATSATILIAGDARWWMRLLVATVILLGAAAVVVKLAKREVWDLWDLKRARVVARVLLLLSAVGAGIAVFAATDENWWLSLLGDHVPTFLHSAVRPLGAFVAGVAVAVGVPLATRLVRELGALFGLSGRRPTLERQTAALLLGVLMLAVGLAWVSELAIGAKSAKERPQVTASLEEKPNGIFLASSVHAAGLNSDEHILIRVEGRSTSRKLAARYVGANRQSGKKIRRADGDFYQLLYGAQVGPDPSGKVDYPFTVRVSPALYERVVVSARLMTQKTECTETQSKKDQQAASLDTNAGNVLYRSRSQLANTMTPEAGGREPAEPEEPCERSCIDGIDDLRWGCATVLLPETAAQPRLSAEWKLPVTSPPILDVTVQAADIEPAKALQLLVRGIPGRVVYRASVGASSTGSVDSTLSIPVDARFTRLCVTAAPLLGHPGQGGSKAHCPTGRGRLSAVLMQMPRQKKAKAKKT